MRFFAVPTNGTKSSAVWSVPPSHPFRRIAPPSVTRAMAPPIQGIVRVMRLIIRFLAYLPS
jgi:hypothetical protein